MKRLIMLSVLAMGVGGWAAMQSYAAEATPAAATQKAEDDEVAVKLEDCPKAVQDTIKKEVGSGKIDKLVKEVEDGKMIYSVDAKIDGKDYEINVAEDGTLISKKLDTDEGDKKEETGQHEDKK